MKKIGKILVAFGKVLVAVAGLYGLYKLYVYAVYRLFAAVVNVALQCFPGHEEKREV